MTIIAALLGLSIVALTPPRFKLGMAVINVILVLLMLIAEYTHPHL